LFFRGQSAWFWIAAGVFFVQILVAVTLKEGFVATLVGTAVPLVFSSVLIILCTQNARISSGHVRLFWRLNAAAFVCLFLSYAYWFYQEVLRRQSSPNPLLADSLFFLMPALLLASLALRPHLEFASSNLRFRALDLVFLLSWWFCFYLYFAVPWVAVAHEFASYNRANYLLNLAEQMAVVGALLAFWSRTVGAWRRFYGHACLGLAIYALADFVQGLAMDAHKYYSGGIYDVPIGLGGLGIVYAFAMGSKLPREAESPAAEPERQAVWAARLGMLAMISLPLLAIFGYLGDTAPAVVIAFRLRLILAAMFFLGLLGFFRLHILDRELQRLVSVTESSYQSLRNVQDRIAHSQKLAALGRLASGATHEISNPLTAIYCYSDLLTDNPSLSQKERLLAQEIREQVRLAQAAVLSVQEPVNSPLVGSPGSPQDPVSS
jgi:signal transduction histidine kinase